MRKIAERITLSAYGKKKSGESTLEIPTKTLVLTCIIALVAAFIIATLFLKWEERQSTRQLSNSFISAKINTDNKTQEDIVLERLKKLLPPDIKRKLQVFDASIFSSLLANDSVTFNEFREYMRSVGVTDSSALEKLNPRIVGKIEISNLLYILYYPEFKSLSVMEVLDEMGIPKPNLEDASADHLHEVVEYGLAASLINKFRQSLGEDYSSSRRLMLALGAYIQFITFWFALWALLLIFLRFSWCRIQKNIIKTGILKSRSKAALPVTKNKTESVSIWEFDQTKNPADSVLSDYHNKYGIGLLPVRIIDETLELKHENRIPDNAAQYVNDKVDLLEAGVQKGEYEIINYLMFAIPNLGFIGTIIGIVLSMSNVSGIIESSAQLDQLAAFDKVGGALAFAFDTTAVGLFWVLILSLLLAILKKWEADMFESLRVRSIVAVKYFWKDSLTLKK